MTVVILSGEMGSPETPSNPGVTAPRRLRGAALAVIACTVLGMPRSGSAELTQAQRDSGWVDLFNGKNLTGLYTYLVGGADLGGRNYDNDPLGTFKAEQGMIHASNTVNQGHVGTRKDYSRYRCRVEYRYAGTTGSTNAGFLYHLDTASWKLYGQHPRSVECQMKHNEAGWTFLIANVWMTTTVDPKTKGDDTPVYMPASAGGVPYVQGDRDPKRTIMSSSHTEHWPADTAWNTEEIRVYGADSSLHVVNGKVVMKGTHLEYDKNKDDTASRLPLFKGKIGLQAEGHEVWYRNWHIMELDAEGKPVALARRGTSRPSGRADGLVPATAGGVPGSHGAVRISREGTLSDLRGRKVGSRGLPVLPLPD
ncbi:MAG: hypothetical protein JWP91_1125 [Fibrobacteres bacterium]|nr:hypothetical protein [Fibrobacterota bacterium]